jgi:hypothetical protein
MLEGLTKKLGQKNKKTKIFPRVPVTRHSGKRLFPEYRGQGTRGRGRLPRVLGLGTRGRGFSIFFKRLRLVPPSNAPFLFRVPSSPSVALGEDGLPRVPVFPECHGLLGTRGRLSSPSAILPRVQHSGKNAFPECPIFGSRGSSWHSGNKSSPVVLSGSIAHRGCASKSQPSTKQRYTKLPRGQSPLQMVQIRPGLRLSLRAPCG